MLQKGDVEISNAYVIMTAERMDAVDFTAPILSTRYVFAYYESFNDSINIPDYVTSPAIIVHSTALRICLRKVVERRRSDII
jgi:hypothetical protein